MNTSTRCTPIDSPWTDYEIFATLTYPRTQSIRDTWLRVTSDTNRFIQTVSRGNSGYLEYFRVFEPHKDNYPHVHLHIRFGLDYRIRDRDVFIYDHIRKFLKQSSNGFGNTDFQSPKRRKAGCVGYITKYLGKSTSISRLWQLILNPTFLPSPPSSSDTYPPQCPKGTNIWKLISIPTNHRLLYSTYKWKRIKLASWSRGYIETFKIDRLK